MPERINVAPSTQAVAPSTPELQVRYYRHTDLEELAKLRKGMGVHDCTSSFTTFSNIDPEGLLVVENQDGEIVGSCCSIKQKDGLYFVGLYCVREDYRGKSIGLQIWKECHDHIGAANVGLNAVPRQMALYRDRCGYTTLEKDFTCQNNYTQTPVDPKVLSSSLPEGVLLEPFHKSLLPKIVTYDTSIMGYDRRKLMSLNCREKNSRTIVAMMDDSCVGFGTIKLSNLGAGRVGPLYADDPEVAEAMLKCLVASMPLATSFAMNTLSNNSHIRKMLGKLDCPKTLELVRMYRGERLVVDTKKIYAIFDTSFSAF